MNENQYSVVRRNDQSKDVIFEGDSKEVINWLENEINTDDFDVYVVGTQDHLTARGFVADHKYISLLASFVPKFYVMDPKIEDLLPNGKQLANGMVVLIADPEERERIEKHRTDWVMDKLLTRNRWATVTDVRVIRPKYQSQNKISFIAVYEDGTKRLRTVSMDQSWFVKLDSIPDTVLDEKKEAEKYNKVHKIVNDVLNLLEDDRCSQCYPISVMPDSLASATTLKILGALSEKE